MKKKIAIVGYGGQGAWHASHAQKSDCIELAGIYDINPKRMEAARASKIRTYSSFEEVLADNTLDIVVCATPNDSHTDIVVRSLLAGKNVVCEKPVVIDIADFDKMLLAEKKSGKLLTVHQNRRWDVDFLAMKSIARSKEIGEFINIESRIHGSRGIPSDWRCHKEQGGGMLLDWGVHLIDQALQLIPEKIVSVYCRMDYITTKEVDDGIKLTIVFESGKSALIEVGTYNVISMPRFYLRAEQGSAIIEDWRKKCKVAKLKAWCEKDVLPVQTAAGITKTMAPRDEITVDSYELDIPVSDVHDFYRNFVRAIDGDEQQLVKNTEVLRVLKVMAAAFESDAKGAVISGLDI